MLNIIKEKKIQYITLWYQLDLQIKKIYLSANAFIQKLNNDQSINSIDFLKISDHYFIDHFNSYINMNIFCHLRKADCIRSIFCQSLSKIKQFIKNLVISIDFFIIDDDQRYEINNQIDIVTEIVNHLEKENINIINYSKDEGEKYTIQCCFEVNDKLADYILMIRYIIRDTTKSYGKKISFIPLSSNKNTCGMKLIFNFNSNIDIIYQNWKNNFTQLILFGNDNINSIRRLKILSKNFNVNALLICTDNSITLKLLDNLHNPYLFFIILFNGMNNVFHKQSNISCHHVMDLYTNLLLNNKNQNFGLLNKTIINTFIMKKLKELHYIQDHISKKEEELCNKDIFFKI